MRIALLLALVLVLAGCRPSREAVSPAARPGAVAFTLVQLNDVYEISPLDQGRVGGMARVATLLRRLEAENPNTIAVLAGDFVNPSLISSLSDTSGGGRFAGAQMVAAMNAVGIDYVTFGNHEFDLSAADLQRRLDESAFTYVSANARQQAAGGAAPFVQHRDGRADTVAAFVVHPFRSPAGGAVRVAIVGVTLPSNPARYVRYDDVEAAARRAYEAARAQSDVVVALTHLSIEEDASLARALPGLPLILGGHEHTDTLALVGSTRIAKADANARTVYVHRVTYDPCAGTVDVASELVAVTDAIPDEPQTARVVAAWEARAGARIAAMGYGEDDVVATFDVPYDGREATIRNGPTNLGRLVAHAMLAADPSAQVALLNSGSIRVDDQLEGTIVQRDILRTLPFGGAIVHGRFSGALLGRILDAGLHANKNAGGYLQTSSNLVEADGTYRIDGAVLDPSRTYDVVLPAFLAGGGETGLDFLDDDPSRYTELALQGVGGTPRNDLRDVVIRYLKSGGR